MEKTSEELTITVLPDSLPGTLSPLQLYDYRTSMDIHKSKVSLTKNTISFLQAGRKELAGTDEGVVLENKQFVLMKAGNCLMTEKLAEDSQAYQSILLFFSNELVVRFLERHNLDNEDRSASRSFQVFDYDTFLYGFVESLKTLLQLPPFIQQQLLPTKFEELMLYLTANYGSKFLFDLIEQQAVAAEQLNRIVTNNRLNRLSLRELAFLANMSISTFKREFFKSYGQTPMKWFTEERLKHASILLRTHQLRPADLYEEAGYSDLSNFIQAFKKKFGLTPRQYQNQT